MRGGNTRSTSRQSSQRSLKRLVPERVRRRARRRRVLWALVVLVVVAGFVLLAWPAPPRHLYTQTVQIGQKHADSKQLAFDAAARDSAIGRLPTRDALPLDGLRLPAGALDALLSVDEDEWRAELPLIEEHYATFGEHLPSALHDELDALAKRLTER